MRDEHDRDSGQAMAPEGGPGEPDRPSAPDDQLTAIRKARQARVAKVLVILAIVVILIIFVIANSQPVKVNFVFVSRHPRLIWVMFACALLGGIAGYLIGKPGRQVRVSRRRKEPRPPS